jgi:hypothetical protein
MIFGKVVIPSGSYDAGNDAGLRISVEYQSVPL